MSNGNGKNGNGEKEMALVVVEKQELQKDVSSLQKRVDALRITDDKSRKEASFLLTTVNDALKNAEAKRKTFVDPLNATVKRINAEFKPVTDTLEVIKATIKKEQLRDYHEQERIRREAEETARKEAEEAKRKLDARLARTKDEDKKTMLEQEKANVNQNLNDKLEETAAAVQTTVRTGVGSTNFKKVWKYEVEDLSKVPLEYMMLNETKVGQVVRAGVRNIPGIRIYEDTIVAGR